MNQAQAQEQRYARVAAICRLWQRVSTLTEDEVCAICRQPLLIDSEGNSEIPVCLPCSHTFGAACIQTWLTQHRSCPFCGRDYSDELSNPENRQLPTGDEENHPFLLEDYGGAMIRYEALETAARKAVQDSQPSYLFLAGRTVLYGLGLYILDLLLN